MTALRINGAAHTVDADPNMPLLWVLRDFLGLTGTKYGCGIGTCGTCTVHVNGEARPSCTLTLAEAAGKDIVTIEGLPENSPVFRAWALMGVPQCGYCTPGQIMHAAAVLQQKEKLEEGDATKAMSAVLCRCGTYSRAVAALRLAAKAPKSSGTPKSSAASK